jgi:hypothetical protein
MTSIAPINKGVPVLEGKTNLLSGQLLRWLKDIVNKLNRAVVTDEKGNVSYGGAAIPDDVADGYLHIFYKDNVVRVVDINGNIYDATNAYIRDDAGVPRWQYIGTGASSLFGHESNLQTNKYYAPDNGGQLPTGSSIAWVNTFRIDIGGNINIKAGSTYTATL